MKMMSLTEGNETTTISISGTSGGNFEALTTSDTSTLTVTDVVDTTTVTLADVTIAETASSYTVGVSLITYHKRT